MRATKMLSGNMLSVGTRIVPAAVRSLAGVTSSRQLHLLSGDHSRGTSQHKCDQTTSSAFHARPLVGTLPPALSMCSTSSKNSAENNEANTPMAFIEKAKVFGSNALLGYFTHKGGFDACMDEMKIERMDKGWVKCSMPVSKKVTNAYGTLHGGCIATLVDIVGTIAVITIDPKRAGVSLEMSISYISSAKLGETVSMEGNCMKLGKKIGFTEVKIFGEDGRLVATGRHTKAV